MSVEQPREWQTVCREEQLTADEALEFRLQRLRPDPHAMPLTGFLLLHDGKLRAYLNQCPHLGVELNWMPGRFMDADNLFIQCATHGALFKPDTGECVTGPCQGDALTELELRVEGGAVLVKAPE